MARNTIFLLFFLFTVQLFPQKQTRHNDFNQKLVKYSERFINESNVQLAKDFFIQSEWDSTLVYLAKQLSIPNIEEDLNTYCYFLRGYSLNRKKLYKEATKEFTKIPQDFAFYLESQELLGEIAINQKDFKTALEYFKILEDKVPESSSVISYFSVLENLGVIYIHLEDYKNAQKYLSQSIEEQEKKKDTLRLVRSYTNVANLYYGEYLDSLAIPNFIKAYKLAQTAKDFELKRLTSVNMSVVEENRKDYVAALKYRKEFEGWKDSLNNQNKIYETAQLEKKITVEQKEKEVRVLEAENKAQEAQNKVYLFSGILLVILLTILFASYKGTKKRNKIITAQKEDLDQLNATKDKLFSIVSHDLRSSVNAIKTSNKKLLGNLDSQNKEEISQNLQQNSAIVNGAYGLLDNLLNWAMLQTQQTYFQMVELSLSRIVDHVLFNYQPLLQEKGIELVKSVPKEEIIYVDQESLKIILRNLIDNAIKFNRDSGKIHIYSERSDESYIQLVVEDSGLGMDEETRKELLKDTQLLSKKKHEDILGTGLGLHLVKSMIAKNEGKFYIESKEGEGAKMMVSFLRSKDDHINLS